MAEWVIGQIICRERGFDQMRRDQQNRAWRGSEIQTYRALSTLTIGIVGLGEIGSEIARVCHALGMNTVGLTRRPRREEEREAWVDRYLTELPLLLKTSDYICNVCPSTPATKGLLGAGVLAACATSNGGRGGVFINVGRGDACDEESIVTALEHGWISGAILDVFEVEPLPKESRLWDMPNVVLTPHVSAVTFASDVADVLQANYGRYTSKEELMYVVSLSDGY
jgi:phosphoglycerate dehydrogenase-like enzyme